MDDFEAQRLRLEASEKLRRWLEDISDASVDPWKDQTENKSPVSKNAKSIDPTHDFVELSDLLFDSSSCDESSSEGEENDSYGNYTYRGYRDEEGLFHSNGTITFECGDIIHAEFNHGVRHGDAIVISPRNGISRLIGTYNDGKLQGKGQLVSM